MSTEQNHPLDAVAEDHQVQLSVCNILERIADSLPGDVSPLIIVTARELLDQAFPSHMRFEDEQLFPRLRFRASEREGLSKILDQLTREHHRDEDFALEICEEFAPIAAGAKCRNAEMLGYMLRGFFEGQRSHIELESTTVLPAARLLLRPEDLAGMNQWIAGHRPAELTRSLRQALAIYGTRRPG